MISNSDIEKILDRADIVDVISGFVELKRAGIRYKACCPFHSEDTPSFMVDAWTGYLVLLRSYVKKVVMSLSLCKSTIT